MSATMSDFSSDSDMDVDELDLSFTRASEHVQRTYAAHLPNDLLELYALYKQATVGRCNTSKPGMFNMQGRAKWNAWNDLRDMSTETAKHKYIEKVKQLDPQWHDEVKKGVQHKSTHSWVVHSVHAPPIEDYHKPENEKNCFDHVKECNFNRLKAELKPEHLKELDEHGLGLIHWATDRNSTQILNYLIAAGVDVNMPDSGKQTALHYASSCGHMECLVLLLKNNADRFLKDAEGQTSIDVAENYEVRAVLDIS